ncbi:MAG: 16S rRNA (guanine(527)-N(7))-methyltransferase RsmG [Bacilli bacterium]
MLEAFNLTPLQCNQFQEYYLFLVSENEKYNLTSITSQEEVYIKHFEDSLYVSKAIDLNKITTLLDVGSGAGLPAIPLAILHPKLQVTVVEPTMKKIHFLNELIKKINLTNVTLVNKRVEDLDVSYRQFFDLTIARAVAPLAMLVELIVPFTKINGYFFAMKSLQYQTELQQAKTALVKLKSEVSDIYHYSLSNDMGTRVLIKVLKKDVTPIIYPRKFAQIKQKHL